MRRRLNTGRQSKRLVSLVLVLTLFLGISIEVLKWKVANFVLHDGDFNNLLQNNFLSQHQRSLIETLTRHSDKNQRRLESNTEEEEEEAVPVNGFHFGFFDTLTTEPTQEEYEGLLCQTKAFYEEVLSRRLGNDIFVHLDSVNWTYTPTTGADILPISHLMVVKANLDNGSPIPSKDVNHAIRISDMAEYIEHFVWAAEPRGDVRGVFFETSTVHSEVGLSSDYSYAQDSTLVGNNLMTMGNIALKSSAICPPNGYYELILEYGFFPGFSDTSPTDQEIHDIIPLSTDFFTRTLQTLMHTKRKIQVKLKLKDWKFDNTIVTDEYQLPLTVTFHLMAVLPDDEGGDAIPLEYVKEKLANSNYAKTKMMKDYIQQAVWETPPFKKTTLWNVNRVRMNSRVFQYIKNDEPGSGVAAAPAASTVEPQNDNGANTGGEVTGAPSATTVTDGLGGSNLDLGPPESENTEATTSPTSVTTGSTGRTGLVLTELQPVSVSDENCRQYLDEANSDLNRYLTATEYLSFVNYMTNDTYHGYPYEGLPDVVQNVFESMAIMNDEDEEAIDLLGSFQPDIEKEDLNILATTRANKVCRYLQSHINTAVALAPVETIALNSTVDFFLSQQHDEPTEGSPDMEVVNTAFQHVVEKEIAPLVESRVEDRRRKRKDRRQLSRRELALQAMRRHLEDDASVHITPNAANIFRVEETGCRGVDADNPEMTCYNATGEVDIFLKGHDVRSLAPELISTVEKALDDSVSDGELEEELKQLDPHWEAAAMQEAPSAAPLNASSVGPPSTGPPSSVGPGSAGSPLGSPGSASSGSVNPPSSVSPGSPTKATSATTPPPSEPQKEDENTKLTAMTAYAAVITAILFLVLCSRRRKVRTEDDESNKDPPENDKGGDPSRKLQEEETEAQDASLPDGSCAADDDGDGKEEEHEEQPEKEGEDAKDNEKAQGAATAAEEGKDEQADEGEDAEVGHELGAQDNQDEQQIDDGSSQPAIVSRNIGDKDCALGSEEKNEEEQEEEEGDDEEKGSKGADDEDDEKGTPQDETEGVDKPEQGTEVEGVLLVEEAEAEDGDGETGEAHDTNAVSADPDVLSANLGDDVPGHEPEVRANEELPQDIEGNEDNDIVNAQDDGDIGRAHRLRISTATRNIVDEQDGDIGAAQDQSAGNDMDMTAAADEAVEEPMSAVDVQENIQDGIPQSEINQADGEADGVEAKMGEEQSSNIDTRAAGEGEAVLGTEASQEETSQTDNRNVEEGSATAVTSAEGPADTSRSSQSGLDTEAGDEGADEVDTTRNP